MKANIYSHHQLIGTAKLQITDESMGVISGPFFPNENYAAIRPSIWNFHHSNAPDKYDKLSQLRINAQLENHVFLYPIGGFLIDDIGEEFNDPLTFEAAGNYRHVLEDYFLSQPPKAPIVDPWEFLLINQKIAYEEELFKEIGKTAKKGFWSFLQPKEHLLSDYEFSAMAKLCSNDDVLFAMHKKGESKYTYAVIHLTWKGKREEDDRFPAAAFFKNFDQFLNERLYFDKKAWEE